MRGRGRRGGGTGPAPAFLNTPALQVAKALTGLPPPTFRGSGLAGALILVKRVVTDTTLAKIKIKEETQRDRPYEILGKFAQTCLYDMQEIPTLTEKALFTLKSVRDDWWWPKEDLGTEWGTKDSPTQPLPPKPPGGVLCSFEYFPASGPWTPVE